MALVIADRVKETTTTSGTSDFVLAGAVTGFSTFSSALSNSDTTYYVCVDGSNFEVGLGTFVSGTTTLQRTTVLASTNSNNKVSFSSSAKEVFITYPADKAVFIDGTGDISVTGNINFGDNDKAIFGAGSDLQIFHDAGHSRIVDAGTGNLRIQADNLRLQRADGVNNYITADNGGAATLYHNGLAKLATTSTGVDVTGTVTASSNFVTSGTFGALYKSSDSQILYIAGGNTNASGGNIRLYGGTHSTDASDILLRRGGTSVAKLDGGTGDISFFASDGTTQALFFDASTQRLGLGTSSPSNQLHIYGTSPIIRLEDSGASGRYARINADGSLGALVLESDSGGVGGSIMNFKVGGSERMRIDSSGRVGIGTTATTGAKLKVDGGSTAGTIIQAGNAQGGVILGAESSTAYINTTSATPLAFEINNTERMRIDSSGQIGISGSTASFDTTGSVNGLQLYYETDSGLATVGPYSGGGSTQLTFHTNSGGGASSERMRINSSGNVGIGTASPERALHVEGAGLIKNTSGEALFKLQAANNSNSILELADTDDGNVGRVQYEHDNNAMLLFTSDSERLRIDSSGNLLVGKTALGGSTNGLQVKPAGELAVTRDGNHSLILNRKSSDGNIALFQKDATTVGSISSSSGKIAITLDPRSAATTGSGFLGGDGAIFPSDKTGVASDADVSLGGSSTRFKDLYLSGDITTAGNIDLQDNDRLRLGSSDDLQIYHNGSHSLIQETGTGNLYIASDTNVIISNSATSETKAVFATNGAVNLYFDNVAKLGTKSDGVDIAGELQADSLDIDGAADISGNVTIADQIIHSGDTNTTIRFPAADQIQLTAGGRNNLKAYSTTTVINEDSADHDFRVESNGSTHMLFVNGGNNRVGINDSNPSHTLDVTGDINFTGTLRKNGSSYVADNTVKSWVNFDQRTSLSIRDSFNTSSVTDNGNGLSTSNFSSNFANDDYVFSGNSDGRTGSHFSVPCTDADLNGNAGTYSTSAHKRVTANIGGSPIDFNFISCLYHGDT